MREVVKDSSKVRSEIDIILTTQVNKTKTPRQQGGRVVKLNYKRATNFALGCHINSILEFKSTYFDLYYTHKKNY